MCKIIVIRQYVIALRTENNQWDKTESPKVDHELYGVKYPCGKMTASHQIQKLMLNELQD